MEPEREGREARVESLALEVKIVEVEAVEVVVVVEGGRRRLDKWRKRTFHPASEKRSRRSRAPVK